VYVISGDQTENAPSRPFLPQRTSHWLADTKALFVVAICTGLAALLFNDLNLSHLVMLYLLGVTFVAFRYGRGPSVLASGLSVAAVDFFYVPPYFTFEVADVQYFITFLVMLVVALLISTLTVQIGAQAEAARERERRTAALYALTREM